MITATQSLYCVPAIPEEKQRLGKQYLLKKAVYGMSDAIPSYITDNHLAKMTNVLDVGAGTCVWTLDFARMPQISSRLRTNISDTPSRSSESMINLYACDVDATFFPDKSITEALGITTFQQDLTKPFPSELYDKFDLIHVSFLAICLTVSGWESALGTCLRLLKPGGLLFIDELSPFVVHSPESYLEKSSINVEEYMKGNTWLEKANCIYTGHSVHRGFITDLTFRLPEMLQAVGLRLNSSQWAFLPLGKTCRTLKGLGGDDLADFEDFSISNLLLIWLHQCRDLMKENALEAPRGVKITDEEGIERLLNDIREGLCEEGCVIPIRYFVAQK